MLSAITVSTSFALPLSGGFSDIFGRRWFVLIGCVIGIIASIVAICANKDYTIIVASIIGGFQAGSQQLALVIPSSLRCSC
jgi:MFS family permease